MRKRYRQSSSTPGWVWVACAATPLVAWAYRYAEPPASQFESPPTVVTGGPAWSFASPPPPVEREGQSAPQPTLPTPADSTPLVPTWKAPIADFAAPDSASLGEAYGVVPTPAPGPMLMPPTELPRPADPPQEQSLAFPSIPEADVPEADVARQSPSAPSPSIATELAELQGQVLPTESEVAEAGQPNNRLTLSGSMTGQKIEDRARRQIREGYELARRGAYYAAEKRFVGTLKLIAEAKDARTGTVRRSMALAAGLRALDEANDFLALPAQADAKVEIDVLVRSHKTPIGRSDPRGGASPVALADRYCQYAQSKLAAAVAGEASGSMALHALGKLHGQMHSPGATDYPQAVRRAVAFQQAALLARDDNYLAAHELGVLLAETGHYAEAGSLLRQVAAEQPDPTVLKNLARVERSLGNLEGAEQANRYAAQLAARIPDPRVAWLPPQQFAQVAPPDGAAYGALAVPGSQSAPGGWPAQTARNPVGPQSMAIPDAARFMR
ncbi:MAG: hypothetical protein KF688_11345 [Pirellulales bacterium]|nr:hypothetical protein [Pirellulales bacterium]